MFDRQPDAVTASTVPASVDTAANDTPTARESAARLCAAYDRLLDASDPDVALDETEASELIAMAGIYDLETDRPHAEVWAELRAVLDKSAPQEDSAVTPAEALEPMTVLVVEDDPETAADLTEALTDAGHSVVGPFHAAEAAEAAAALHRIDVALLDINLSGDTDGVALARSLKDRWGLPVLFLSGDVTATARHADLAEAIVLKPYAGRDVLAALAHFQAGLRRQRG
jgi:CheY-like chemotaxis protein